MIPINKLNGFFIVQANRIFQQDVNRKLVEKKIPMNIDQWPVLLCLLIDGSKTQQELAIATQKDKANLGRNIEALEKNGLVSRENCKKDRRKKIVSITPKVLQLLPEIKNVLVEQANLTTTEIPDEELEIFRKVVRKMMHNVQGEKAEIFVESFMERINRITKIK